MQGARSAATTLRGAAVKLLPSKERVVLECGAAQGAREFGHEVEAEAHARLALLQRAGAAHEGFEELGRVAEQSGAGVERLGRRRDARPLFIPGELCCDLDGFSLHAKVEIAAHDRGGLERLCRYLARPPIATERLSLAEDGRVVYALRRLEGRHASECEQQSGARRQHATTMQREQE